MMAFEEFDTLRVLESVDPPQHRRMVETKHISGGIGRAMLGHGLQNLQIIPAELVHCRTMIVHFCQFGMPLNAFTLKLQFQIGF